MIGNSQNSFLMQGPGKVASTDTVSSIRSFILALRIVQQCKQPHHIGIDMGQSG
jgi:hypothetical protein